MILANVQAARSPEPATEGERRRHILDRRPSDLDPVPRYRRHGKGEAISVRDVRQTIQEPKRPQIPPCTFAKVQPGALGSTVQPTSCLAGPECRCQRCWRRYDGNGQLHVLIIGRSLIFYRSTTRPNTAPSYLIPHGQFDIAWRSFRYRSGRVDLIRISPGVPALTKVRATSLPCIRLGASWDCSR